MKFYFRRHGTLAKTIEAWKVYDVMPDDMPKAFKKSKLVCYDEVELKYSMSGASEANVHMHSMTDSENMKKHLFSSVEISEEKFNCLYIKCANLKNAIKQAIEDEDNM